jgi:hypothetical protein
MAAIASTKLGDGGGSPKPLGLEGLPVFAILHLTMIILVTLSRLNKIIMITTNIQIMENAEFRTTVQVIQCVHSNSQSLCPTVANKISGPSINVNAQS